MARSALSFALRAVAPLRKLIAQQIRGVLHRNSQGALPSGPRRGVVSGDPQCGPEIRLLVMGDSTAGGSEVPTFALSLAGQLASALGGRTRRSVRWAILTRGGITAETLLTKYVPWCAAERPDLIVIALGANVIIARQSPAAWKEQLTRIVDGLRETCGEIPIVLTSMPPIARLEAIPQPVRALAAVQAVRLDAAARSVTRKRRNVLMASSYLARSGFLGPDGCHPSVAGYAEWSARLAGEIAPFLTESAWIPPARGGPFASALQSAASS
ncbi:MAG: SGNH/GDSL hydrolase family protein [Acidobacteria bacterium]|nr:SGNH/GDSL hydrolase family protein [Acidobacteriota bacterium]